MSDKTYPFRVHLDDGSHWDTHATDAQTARKNAKRICTERNTVVSKVKLIREHARG